MKTLYPVIIAIMLTVTIISLTLLDVFATCATVNGLQQCAGSPPILTSIKSDKLNYENFDKPVITITGVPYSPAYLEIDDPSGNIVFSHKIDSIQFGVANYTLDISLYKPGVYSASASNSESKVSTTFAVGLLPSGILLVVSTPNFSYVDGEIIPISGHTQRNSSVHIFLLDNYGNVENSTQVMSNNTGFFSANLGIPSHVIGGGWYLFAKSGEDTWMSEIMVNTHGVSTMTLHISNLPPLKQFRLGIDPYHTVCRQDLQLMIKLKDNSPACVKSTSIERLLKQGWVNAYDRNGK